MSTTPQVHDKGTKHVRMNADLHRRLKIRAAQEGYSLTRIVNALVERFLHSVSAAAANPATPNNEKD